MPFTKGSPVMKIPVHERSPLHRYYGPASFIESDTRLYDLSVDPGQEHPVKDEALEARLAGPWPP